LVESSDLVDHYKSHRLNHRVAIFSYFIDTKIVEIAE